MKIDWFDFWLIFSWILLLFLLIGLIIRFFQWLKFRQELAYIKEQKIQNIVNVSHKNNDSLWDSSQELLKFKEEMDYLKKDVCFDLYDRNMTHDSTDQWFDFEDSLEKLLDGKILELIKEKDLLLEQKDGVIWSLEEKNQKILKEVVHKMFFVLQEKDKLLREKDALILHLKAKIQEITLTDLDAYVSQLSEKITHKEEVSQQAPVSEKPHYHHHGDFLNVNVIGKK